MELGQGRVRMGVKGKVLHPEGGRALEQAPHGSGHVTEPAGVQEAFGQWSQTHGLIFGWSCEEPGVGLDESCGPFQLRIF